MKSYKFLKCDKWFFKAEGRVTHYYILYSYSKSCVTLMHGVIIPHNIVRFQPFGQWSTCINGVVVDMVTEKNELSQNVACFRSTDDDKVIEFLAVIEFMKMRFGFIPALAGINYEDGDRYVTV